MTTIHYEKEINVKASYDVIVAGSAIFRGDAAENVKKFKSIMSVW